MKCLYIFLVFTFSQVELVPVEYNIRTIYVDPHVYDRGYYRSADDVRVNVRKYLTAFCSFISNFLYNFSDDPIVNFQNAGGQALAYNAPSLSVQADGSVDKNAVYSNYPFTSKAVYNG